MKFGNHGAAHPFGRRPDQHRQPKQQGHFGHHGHHDMREEGEVAGPGPDRRGHHGRPERGRHGGGPHGPFGRARRGEARYILLDTLREGPKHGYEIIKNVEQRSGGQYSPSPGTVYPTMQYLGEQGLVRTSLDGERRVFHLTPEGTADLDAHVAEIAEFWARFSPSAGSRTLQREAEFVQQELDDLARTVWRARSAAVNSTEGADILRSIRGAVEKCKNEVRDILTRTPSDDREAG